MARGISLLIVKDQSAEDAASPEFRYLLSWLVNQARKAFDPVTLEIRRPDTLLDTAPLRRWGGSRRPPHLPPTPATAVLILGRANVLCTARTFRRLRDALLAGADVALPRPLTSVSLAERPPLYTLRDFELLEAEVLEGEERSSDGQETQLPISLLSWSAFERGLARFPDGELFTRPCRVSELGSVVAGTGLFHEFGDYYGEAREDVLPWLPPGATHVLEIGCARGLTGALIQERLGCRVTGVELNPEIAREAEGRLWRVLRGDIQTLSLDDRYDAIVATELFEHLEEPAALLRKLAPCLAPGGRIILSVPNVGHYSVVEDLLAGRWDYVPVGLLCYTHVRFFTRATLQDWLERAWDGRIRIVPQTTELPERFTALSAILPADRESLGTKGFWVILEPTAARDAAPFEEYTIRGYEPGDETRILELFEQVFHHRRDLAHWAWKFRDSPYGGLRISLAVDAEGRAAAQYAAYPVPFFHSSGAPVIAHQIGDQMTRPGARGRLGTSLVARAARDFYARFCAGRVAFNYCFLASRTEKLSVRLLSSERVEPVPFRRRELDAAPLPAPGRWRRLVSRVAVEPADTVDGRWDAFFRDVAPAYVFLTQRDARYVRWRYLQRPDARYLLLAARRRGVLVAWAVFTRRAETLIWGDALVHPDHPDAVASLLHAALAGPLGHGARSIQGWFPARPAWFAATLDRLGFRLEPEPEGLSLMCVPWQEPDAIAQMRRDLYYTYGDSDLF
jgi:SAM-dependent methyltransferase